jgi:hypothetical protein
MLKYLAATLPPLRDFTNAMSFCVCRRAVYCRRGNRTAGTAQAQPVVG